MNIFIVEQTEFTPKVLFEPASATYKILGRSYLEDPQEFFEKILVFIDRYFPTIDHAIKLEICIEYFNSVSSRYLMAILRKLEILAHGGHEISVVWKYVDLETLSDGHMYESLVDLPFEFVLDENS